MRAPFLYRKNGWTDCAKIWYVVRDHGMHFAQAKTRYIYTCVRALTFLYLGTGWPQFAAIWYVAKDPLASCFSHVMGKVRLHVRTALQYLGKCWTHCAEGG